MAQKISYWLLIALVLSLGFGQLLRLDFLSVPVYVHDILVIVILLFSLRSITIPKGLKIFIFGLFLSSVRAITLYPLPSLLVPSLYALRLLAYVALYLVIRQSKIKVPSKYFYLAAVVSLLIGLMQYFLMPDMRWAQYLGFDDHLSRLVLPHFDPTFTGVMFGLALLMIPLQKLYLHGLLGIGILLTYSRSVWLSLIVTAMLFIKNKKLLFLAIIVVIMSIIALPQRFGEGTNLLRTYSITSRYDSDTTYIKKYGWDLLIGRGMNTLILDSAPSLYDNHATGPNNSYLYLLVTTGLLGLIGWGIFMYSLYQGSIYKPMLAFFFVASLFNNVMFYPFALLWVLLIDANKR